MIVGVDLGTRRAALACIDIGWVWWANLDTTAMRRAYPSEWQMGNRLGDMAGDAMHEVGLNQGEPDEFLYFERPVVFKSVNTSVGQALSAGAFFANLCGQAVQIYPSSVWKKEVVGSGNASKDDTRAWVESVYPALAEACAGIEDCYDAVAICEYGRRVAELG